VPSARTAVVKTSSAIGALEGLQVRVYHFVSFQACFIEELFAAKRTRDRIDCVFKKHMALQLLVTKI
jgi:hypothetical protein